MDWLSLSQGIELGLGFALVTKLLSLHLQRVYRYFCVFLLADISGLLIWVVARRAQGTPLQFDYRYAWLAGVLVAWIFTLLTLYALFDAILIKLPGILKLSHAILNYSFAAALLIGVISAFPEYRTAVAAQVLRGPFAHVVFAAFVLDRVVDSVALIVLLCILLFLVWFPVAMSRNLVTFFIGFVIYFALKATLMLSVNLRANGASVNFSHLISVWGAVLSTIVFAYWMIFITKVGEKATVKIHVPTWHRKHEELLVAQLEAMNSSLLRAARR